jgi:alkanesulfonate monooxygenase SsuD/methylene tetrahydromethanopterin reductase-like flavin-dependent oxidoreductase (luciferase family)
MRVGYLVDTHGADLDAMIEEGLAAERAGFHSVVVPDRHGGPTAFPGPEQLLTLLARETARVALGTFTFVGTLVHPMKAAEQFSVIDNLSRGRLFTTVSRGFVPEFWGQFGIPEDRMLGRFLETLKIWRAAFAGESFDFAGRHWQVRGGRLAPPPFQAGGWPIWGGGNANPEAAARSATYGECWTADPFPLTDADWAARAGAYRERARALGKRPYIVQLQDGWVADSYEAAARTFGPHFARIARFYFRRGQLRHPDFQSEADLTPEKLGRHLVMGTPAQCRERLEWLHAERGVDYVILCSRLSTGPDFAPVREQLQRMGEEVVAPLHAAHPPPDHPAIPLTCRT